MTPIASTVAFDVRWGECDPAGIVYHPNYLDWFSVARMRLLADYGLPYMTSFHDNGVVLVVLEATCSFKKVVRVDDHVSVRATLTDLSRTRMSVLYKVVDAAHQTCAVGHTHHAFVDLLDHAPVNVAKRCPQLWEKLSALWPKP